MNYDSLPFFGKLHIWVFWSFEHLSTCWLLSLFFAKVYVRIRDTEWNVYRRYSQFFDLHQSLRKKDPIVNSFDFPPKKTVGNMGERFVEDRRRALQSYLRCIVNYLVRLVLDIFETSDFLARLVFDILEASKWLLLGDHQRGTVYVPRQSNSSHISSLLCGCSRQFQQVRS